METLNLQTHGIAVYPNRKRLFWFTSLMVLLFLPMLGVDVFAIWAFWNHIWAFWHRYEIDTGAYVAATMLSIGTFFVGWGMFVALYRLRRRGPAIIINSQGFYTDFPLHFTFLLRSRQSFIPWEEIEWISSFHLSPGVMYTWLSLSLKDPAHYSHGLRNECPWNGPTHVSLRRHNTASALRVREMARRLLALAALLNDLLAKVNTFAANEDSRAGNQPLDLVLLLATERAARH